MPLLSGGGQENYHRGGTENVAAIAGFGAACEWHQENLTKNIKIYTLRDSIEEQLGTISTEAGNEIAQPVFFGKQSERLGNTSCFAVPGIKAETALMALDLDGISVSSGSACSSGKVKRSHVLEAMGASQDEMEGAVRLSLGWQEDNLGAERLLAAWKTIVSRVGCITFKKVTRRNWNMPAVQETIDTVALLDVDKYKYGFSTDIENDMAPKGLSEEVIRFISAKKEEPEWMLQWRLDAYERWKTMEEPNWARVDYPKIDFNDIYYYAAPKNFEDGPKSLDEVDPDCLKHTKSLAFRLKSKNYLQVFVNMMSHPS